MEPEHYKFGGGSTETVLHPVVLATMVVVTIILFVCPRRYRIGAFLFGMFLIPAGQQFVVAGVHLFINRIIVLVGLLTMVRFRRTPVVAGNWNSIDTAFSLSALSHVIAFTLLYSETAATINQAGLMWDYLAGYLLLRYLIRSNEDIVTTIRCFAVLAVIFAGSMIREQMTGQNLFGLLGGVRLLSEVRQGSVRSEAVFQHAILAGTFGGTLLPLFVLLWKSAQSKVMAAIGVLSATVMTVTAACSTPLLSYAAGIVAIFLWPLRRRMRWIRWGLAMGLLFLNLIMHAPVWYLISHVSVLSGSSADQRAELVDTFLRHIDDWWLLGTKSNCTWGAFTFDTSNQYVQQGVTGGLTSLVLFIATISCSFGRIGKARKALKGTERRSEWFLWLLGSALFANIVAFFGISYFDQTRIAWFALLAMISAATTASHRGSTARVTESHYVSPTPTLEVTRHMFV
jgi:hypothetical protein